MLRSKFLKPILCWVFALSNNLSHAIQGGIAQTERGLPGIIKLTSSKSAKLCSATLIGERTLLTAAHCQGQLIGKVTAHVAGKLIATQLYGLPSYDPENSQGEHDLALGILERPINNITPVTLSNLPPIEGQRLLITGYGASTTRGEGTGQLRSGVAVVAYVEENFYRLRAGPSLTLGGDSGGATLVLQDNQWQLIGVHSKRSIKGEYSAQTRVDASINRQWLEEMALTHQVQVCGINTRCAPSALAPHPKWNELRP